MIMKRVFYDFNDQMIGDYGGFVSSTLRSFAINSFEIVYCETFVLVSFRV